MIIDVPKLLLNECRQQGVVILAGAGISAAAPSSLPGWNPLNQAIFDAICDRVDNYLNRPDYTAHIRSEVHERRNAHLFPPDYQAQILAESFGDDYFRALQAVDIPTFNSAHFGIAQLAKYRIVKAVVTTNFDKLIEKALESDGIPYEVAYEPVSYMRCAQTLSNMADNTPIQILKLHGSVQDHRSMIDTLKQRLLGRNDYLAQCVATLLEKYLWLYMGFSAADLESDPKYLGIVAAADKSPGLVYVSWPGAKELSPGAELLINAYGKKANVVVGESDEVLAAIARGLNLPWIQLPEEKSETNEYVNIALNKWASELSPANAFMGLAAVLEANSESTLAFEVLHRLWNNRSNKLKDGDPNFDRFRLMHGRLGMGTGIMSLVEDLSTERGMENIQNLLRVASKDRRAYAWSGLAWAWAGNFTEVFQLLRNAEPIFTEEAASLESKVDSWLAMSEVTFLLSEVAFRSNEFANLYNSWGIANKWAEQAGDLPRQARVATFFMLMLAEFMDDSFESFHEKHASVILKRSARLHDPNIEGFQHLARGRMAIKHRDAATASESLSLAVEQLARAGRYPWCMYAQIEYAKALMDQQRFQEAGDLLDHIEKGIDRYQLLLPWYEEARGQHHLLLNRKEVAYAAFQSAVDYAEKMGLSRRAKVYREYIDGTSPS